MGDESNTKELIKELNELLDSEELAKALRLRPKTVYNLHSQGVLEARRRLRGRPLFDFKESLERYNRIRNQVRK